MLEEKFEGRNGAFIYLEEAERNCQESGNLYRYFDAIQSHAAASYFAIDYDNFEKPVSRRDFVTLTGRPIP